MLLKIYIFKHISCLKKVSGNLIKCLLLSILFVGQGGFSQNKSHDAILYQAIVKTAGTDADKAMQMADSLYRASTEPLHKVKSLMLLAELNLTTGKKKESLDHAFKAEQIASDNNLYEWQARIFGFIASHYRSIGLKKQSKTYLKKGMEAISNVENLIIVNQYKGLVYQELALYEAEDKNYVEAIKYFNIANGCFKYIKNNELRNYQLATNNAQLGRVYTEIRNKEKAIAYFNKALHLLKPIQNEAAVVKGFIHEGIGRAHLEGGDLQNAYIHLEKAAEIAKHSNDLNLNEEVYCDLAIYYMEIGDKENFKKYNTLYEAARETSSKVNKESSEIVVNRLQERQEELAFKKNIIITVFLILSVFLIITVLVLRYRRKKEYVRFQEIIHSLSSRHDDNVNNDNEIAVPSEEGIRSMDISEKELMSKEAEQAILNKLTDFEKSNVFTNKNITLSGLSVMLETNSKYLSYVINKHKRKDFNNYINELRINYIIRKLESSPDYLNYKISYLAEDSGFSSHSKFTDKFKTITGLSPSTFINYLKKENRNDVA